MAVLTPKANSATERFLWLISALEAKKALWAAVDFLVPGKAKEAVEADSLLSVLELRWGAGADTLFQPRMQTEGTPDAFTPSFDIGYSFPDIPRFSLGLRLSSIRIRSPEPLMKLNHVQRYPGLHDGRYANPVTD